LRYKIGHAYGINCSVQKVPEERLLFFFSQCYTFPFPKVTLSLSPRLKPCVTRSVMPTALTEVCRKFRRNDRYCSHGIHSMATKNRHDIKINVVAIKSISWQSKQWSSVPFFLPVFSFFIFVYGFIPVLSILLIISYLTLGYLLDISYH